LGEFHGAGPDYDPRSDILGAATAACLAAAAAFRLVHGGRLPSPTAINLLERTANEDAASTSAVGPIQVGDVLVVGAGAVAHATLYWAREFGVTGSWDVVDADLAKLHNTNRCLGMYAEDAGWPGGSSCAAAEPKTSTAARLIGATPHEVWFEELAWAAATRPDLVLPLANERGVRSEVASLGEALLIHASTSQDWTAELHRHIAGRDDCPNCRLPEPGAPIFGCSTGPTNLETRDEDGESADAALPFLSAAAGLILVAALLDLPGKAAVLDGRFNHWRLHMWLGPTLWEKLPHVGGQCGHALSAAVRTVLHQDSPRRWDAVT
jgi:hypothetical protein